MSTHDHVFIIDHSQMLEASRCPSMAGQRNMEDISKVLLFFFLEEEGNSGTWFKTDEPCGQLPEQTKTNSV